MIKMGGWFMSKSREEYDLLVVMLLAFKKLGGDAVNRCFSAWKEMSDECTSFEYKQHTSDKILFDFIDDLTKDKSTLCIGETEENLHSGILVVKYCLIKGYDIKATILAEYILKQAKIFGFSNIENEAESILENLFVFNETKEDDETDKKIIILNDGENEAKFETLDVIRYKNEEKAYQTNLNGLSKRI